MTVINLASQTSRWEAASRQFHALHLQPVRQLALPGSALDAAEAAGLAGIYSGRLNGMQYHKPLEHGEIGCYASHMQAWQQLLASGAAAMAIFEDDVEIDADLALVLEALAQMPVAYDLVKLIGRPVDVDLRHWWACGLDVHPYPVRGAAWGRQRTHRGPQPGRAPAQGVAADALHVAQRQGGATVARPACRAGRASACGGGRPPPPHAVPARASGSRAPPQPGAAAGRGCLAAPRVAGRPHARLRPFHQLLRQDLRPLP